MPDLIVLPDVVGPSLRWLATISQVTAIFGDKIGIELPADDDWPACRLDPIGGFTPIEWRLDQPNLQVHSFAMTGLAAMDGARTLRAAFFAMVGHREPDVIVVVDVRTSSPRLVPDTDRTPPVSHSTFTAAITVRSDP